MIIIALYITAPILQIIASIFSIKGMIRMPIGGIMMTAFILGVICSFWAMTTLPVPPQTTPMPRCGMPEFGVLMGGVFLQIILAPLIAMVCYTVYWFKKRMRVN